MAAEKIFNIGVISLGCDKNRVDTEKMLFEIRRLGHTITPDITKADIVIINTCAFLLSARKEAIDSVFEAKTQSGGKPVIVTGCLPQKYAGDLYKEFTEVSAFLGVNDYDKIGEAIAAAADGVRYNGVGSGKGFSDRSGRVLTTKGHYAYLMIADGCDNRCTYCLIPYIRGKYRSRSVESIVNEAKELAAGGVKELILVAQDVTRYGIDLYGRYETVRLLRELSAVGGVKGIRLLYCYPELVTDELIEEIKNNDKIIKYIDIPLQHISDNILKKMGRRTSGGQIKELLVKLRQRVKGISIRSTFIIGFPGETEEDFKELCAFLSKYKLDNVGFFAYSREEGTAAAKLISQVHYATKQRRLKEISLLQTRIYHQKNKEFIGKTVTAVCDGYDEEKALYYGRTYREAPQIDKRVYFGGEKIKEGESYEVLINSCDEYDIYGVALKPVKGEWINNEFAK